MVHNDAAIERDWAEAAGKYAEMFEKMIINTKTEEKMQLFKFTPKDDEIYRDFRNVFPNVKVEQIDLEQMKTTDKRKWHDFLELRKTICKEYNTGTLLRLDYAKQCGPENCTLVPRLQFYCIELARFRENNLNWAFRNALNQ